jgi:hypothetical protein
LSRAAALKKSLREEPVAKAGYFCNRLLQFFALRARTKVRQNMHFSAVAVAKLQFCNSLGRKTKDDNTPAKAKKKIQDNPKVLSS